MMDQVERARLCPLFEGIGPEDMGAMLDCLGSQVRSYPRGTYIALEEEDIRFIVVVLAGTVQMIKEDVWGNKTILTLIREREVFGETFACGAETDSVVTFYAAEDVTALILPFHRVLHLCPRSCDFHQRLVENMVTMLAAKNRQLMEKIEVVAKKKLREKILAYLSQQAQHSGGADFTLPMGRVDLADYLCANRSALTRELAAMKDEGLIDYDKDTFHLNIKMAIGERQ